jgi:hypothetical protein
MIFNITILKKLLYLSSIFFIYYNLINENKLKYLIYNRSNGIKNISFSLDILKLFKP